MFLSINASEEAGSFSHYVWRVEGQTSSVLGIVFFQVVDIIGLVLQVRRHVADVSCFGKFLFHGVDIEGIVVAWEVQLL